MIRLDDINNNPDPGVLQAYNKILVAKFGQNSYESRFHLKYADSWYPKNWSKEQLEEELARPGNESSPQYERELMALVRKGKAPPPMVTPPRGALGKVWNHPLGKYVEKGGVPVLSPTRPPYGEEIVTREEMKNALVWISEKYHVHPPTIKFNVTPEKRKGKVKVICAVHQSGEHQAGLPISEEWCVARLTEDLLGFFMAEGLGYIAMRDGAVTLETLFHEFYHYVDWRNSPDGRLPPHSAKLEEFYDRRAKEDVTTYRAQPR